MALIITDTVIKLYQLINIVGGMVIGFAATGIENFVR